MTRSAKILLACAGSFLLVATGAIVAPGFGVLAVKTNRVSVSAPVAITSKWSQCITAGGATFLDSATLTNPETQITASTRIRLSRNQIAGTYATLRFGYNPNVTGTTPLTVVVFGRTDTDSWEMLSNRNGDAFATFTPNPTTDDTDGTLCYTKVDRLLHVFDCRGCEEYVVGVKQAFAATTGTTSDCVLFLKGF